jgi:hypothetical protein
MSWIVLESLYVLLVTGTPLLVGWLVAAAARQEVAGLAPAGRLGGGTRRGLLFATVATWVAFGVWFASEPGRVAAHRRDLRVAGAELLSFVVLAALALASIRETVKTAHRIVSDAGERSGKVLRSASLHPRRVTDCLPWPLLGAPYILAAVGGSLLAWRFAGFGGGPDRPFIPLGLAFVGTVFLLLYGAWLSEESHGAQPLEGSPQTDIEALRRRQRRTRAIFVAQVVLVAVSFAASLILSHLNWSNPTGFRIGALVSLVAGLVGVLGCTLALSSGVSRRYLETLDLVQTE